MPCPSEAVYYLQGYSIIHPHIPGSSRFESPGRYPDAPGRLHDGYYPSGEREPPRDHAHSSRDYDRGHPLAPSFDHRERSMEDRFDR